MFKIEDLGADNTTHVLIQMARIYISDASYATYSCDQNPVSQDPHFMCFSFTLTCKGILQLNGRFGQEQDHQVMVSLSQLITLDRSAVLIYEDGLDVRLKAKISQDVDLHNHACGLPRHLRRIGPRSFSKAIRCVRREHGKFRAVEWQSQSRLLARLMSASSQQPTISRKHKTALRSCRRLQQSRQYSQQHLVSDIPTDLSSSCCTREH